MSITFNPFTGNFDFVGTSSGGGADNFSYKKVIEGQSIVVPENQQMLVDGDLNVFGDLMIRGEVKEITKRSDDNGFFFTKIKTHEFVTVKTDRLLLYKNNLMVQGNLKVLGDMAGV